MRLDAQPRTGSLKYSWVRFLDLLFGGYQDCIDPHRDTESLEQRSQMVIPIRDDCDLHTSGPHLFAAIACAVSHSPGIGHLEMIDQCVEQLGVVAADAVVHDGSPERPP